jgi:hypothetical protein
MYMYVYIYAFICTFIYTYTYVCVCVCVFVCGQVASRVKIATWNIMWYTVSKLPYTLTLFFGTVNASGH